MKQRIISLDIVRGLAALSVFLTHLGNPFINNSIGHKIIGLYHSFFSFFFWCNGGLHAGVVVFIVLSGFCIHMPLSKTNEKHPNWKYYSIRRFYRIYPVMVFAILAGLVSLYVTNEEVHQVVKNLIANLFLISSVFPVAAPLGNVILGTVIVECLLYIIYPFGYLAANRYSWKAVLTTCFVVYVLNISWLFLTSVEPSWVQRNIFSFLVYWWIGAFAVQIVSNNKDRGKFNLKTFFLLFIVYLFISHFFNVKGAHYLKSFILAIVTAYLLAILYIYELSKNKSEKRQGKYDFLTSLFSNLGERSYSLYVIHLPVLTVASYYLARYQITEGVFPYAAKIVAVTIFSAVFYYSIEHPFHRYAVKVSSRALKKVSMHIAEP
jgi:peptidoglycan/LPS O-acetylase OafA/YrhL